MKKKKKKKKENNFLIFNYAINFNIKQLQGRKAKVFTLTLQN